MVKKGGIPITEAFYKLEPDKQQRILEAVLKEFATQGYDKASTNRIVQEAGIAKGMLFYYFKNKQELFRYALQHSIKYLTEEYVSKLDYTEPDFITRFQKAVESKMQAYLKNPYPFALLANAYIQKDAIAIAPDLYQELEELTANGLQQMFANIDTTLFRPDLAPEHIINLIRWTIDGWSNETIAALQNQDLIDYDWDTGVIDFRELLAILRKVLYKEEADNGDFKG
ncbi:MAG: TetR/AcrR family transcriptional regulator [Firmicutes bacterium]|nr:TetR/AcrR family transcriptional regulator [Bacillota bacterium]